ncbi:MAG: CPBP family intramembrane metalloprotease [bacterium]|nr:CPBP family intramembrane metalloprotease [bacterium]MDN5835103.1 CPBP family intramembrane metalloprotease [bacterium]
MIKWWRKFSWGKLFLIPLWVAASFIAAQVIVLGLVWLLKFINLPLDSLDQTVFNTIVSLIVYVVTLAIVIGAPYYFKKIKTTRSEIGITRAFQWRDIGFAPLGFIVYFIGAGLLMYLVSKLLPGVDLDQDQATGFKSLHTNWEYVLAFVTLVVIAPIAEEVLFRGYLLGKLKKYLPLWVAIAASSLLFAALHLPGGGEQLQWNVAFNVLVLGVVLGILRPLTGSIWSGVLLHMMKNGLAFYLLFINPLLM